MAQFTAGQQQKKITESDIIRQKADSIINFSKTLKQKSADFVAAAKSHLSMKFGNNGQSTKPEASTPQKKTYAQRKEEASKKRK
jgi:gas vesicle protein